jgi:hypothetical protein
VACGHLAAPVRILGDSGAVTGKYRNAYPTNIVNVAVRMIAGSDPGAVFGAARGRGVSEPTVYRWLRAGNMRHARGADALRRSRFDRLAGFYPS